MQIVSAYLLAASAVDSGNYDEEYYIDPAYDFQEYMEIGGDDIVGENINITAPNNGQGDFSGNQFCGEWTAAFELPIEYMKIYDQKLGKTYEYPDPTNSSDWSEYTVNKVIFGGSSDLVPKVEDDYVYAQTGKHINAWFASVCLGSFSPVPTNGHLFGLTGIYLPSNVSWICQGNYPTKGYAVFSLNNTSGSIVIPTIGSGYNWGEIEFAGGVFTNHSVRGDVKYPFIMVYNPNAFKNYVASLDTASAKDLINETLFILAECNTSRKKR